MIRITAAAIGGFVMGVGGVALAVNTAQLPAVQRLTYMAPSGVSAKIVCLNAGGTPSNIMPSFQRANAFMGANVVAGEIVCP